MDIEYRVAVFARRDRDQDVGDAVKYCPRQADAAILGSAGRVGNGPVRAQATHQRARRIAKAEAEQVLAHAPRSAGAAAVVETGSMSSSAATIALRRCRVSAQHAHDTAAPIASGRRRPSRSLAVPIATAPNAGPARKIMP